MRALTLSRKNTGEDFMFAPNVTTNACENASTVEGSLTEGSQFEFDHDRSAPRRTGRKKPVNHIPRPPNAFILFRSAFIKSRHVSTGVETNHSTLSKIIGITWQNLPEAERQKWHAQAKVAQDEHKRKFPQYSFRPVHKAKGPSAERKRLREVGPKDQKRCAKIAELLVCGKKGQELEDAIQEFDKHHIPEIVTRFEPPITANTFSSYACEQPSFASTSSRKVSSRSSAPPSPASYPASETLEALEIPTTMHSFDPPSFDYSSSSHSFVSGVCTRKKSTTNLTTGLGQFRFHHHSTFPGLTSGEFYAGRHSHRSLVQFINNARSIPTLWEFALHGGMGMPRVAHV